MTAEETAQIRLLFECINEPKSKCTQSKLSDRHGPSTFDACRSAGWIIPGSCDERAAKTPFLTTVKGRDRLRELNNQSAREINAAILTRP